MGVPYYYVNAQMGGNAIYARCHNYHNSSILLKAYVQFIHECLQLVLSPIPLKIGIILTFLIKFSIITTPLL